jgi:hypothetical protein
MEPKPVWKAEQNQNYQRGRAVELITSWTIRYIPPDKVDADGKTWTLAMNFPALVITNWVADPDKVAQQVAQQLNTYPLLLEALKVALVALRSSSGDEERTIAKGIATAAIAAAEAPAVSAEG